MSEVIVITSGKGGVGKTTTSANIGTGLAMLGTRVALAYTLSGIPSVGVEGIWWSVPIGWFLADAAGFLYYRIRKPV